MSPGENASFTRNLIGGAVIAFATAAAIYVGYTLAGGSGPVNVTGTDDDERPPVIVSNGSVMIEVADDQKLSNGQPKGPGKFTQSGNKLIANHQSALNSPVGFRVSIEGSSDCAEGSVYNVRELTIFYSADGSDKENIVISLDSELGVDHQELTIKASSEELFWPDKKVLHKIKAHDGDSSTPLWLMRRVVLDTGQTKKTDCKFKVADYKSAKLTIRQVYDWKKP